MSGNAIDVSVRQAREKALVWKQDLRVVPLSAVIYLLCYLDRSNIGTHTSIHKAFHKILSTKSLIRKCQNT